MPSLDDFEALVNRLGDAITNVVHTKKRCKEPIYPRMIVAIRTLVFAGGNYDDIMN